MNKFDRPYRYLPIYDNKKILELFNLVNELDTNELLKYSLSNQINFDVINDIGNSLIHEVINIDKRRAREHVKLNIIKFLVQNGANPDSPNKMNQTPLHLACHLQLDLIVKYLLEEIKVNPNYTDNLGLYPFHYLFSGEIKQFDKLSKVFEFIPKKKIESFNTKELIEIKKEIWKNIKNDNMIITINETINQIIKDDNSINDRVLTLYELLEKLKITDPSSQKSPQIIDDIKGFNESIINKIKEKFSNFKIEEIEIHKTEENSWLPNAITNFDYSLIKNGNYRKRIRKEILEEMDKINKLIIEYKDFEVNFENNAEESDINFFISELANNHIIQKPRNRVEWTVYANIDLNADRDNRIKILNSINEKLRHEEVINNYSSKIDLKKLTYLGGSNNIPIGNINLLDNNYFQVLLRNILFNNTNPLIPDNYNKIVLFFLFDRNQYDWNIIPLNIITNHDDFDQGIFNDSFQVLNYYINKNKNLNINEIITIFTTTVAFGGPVLGPRALLLQPAINNNIPLLQPPLFSRTVPIQPVNVPNNGFYNMLYEELVPANNYNNNYQDHYCNICFSSYILINYTMILHEEKLDELLDLLNNQYPYNLNNYFLKYFKKIKKSKYDKILITYEMMCECYNILNINITFNNIMLITGLYNNKTNIIKGIVNALKPHLISKYYLTHNDLIKCIILLLNDNINDLFYYNFTNLANNKDYFITNLNNFNLNENTKNLIKIINYYIDSQDNNFESFLTTNNLMKYYKIFNKNNKIDKIQVFKLMIISIYEEMQDKPMKQTLIDFLYLFENNLKELLILLQPILSTRFISIINFTPVPLDFNLSPNIIQLKINDKIPSYFNYNDNIHFKIAHLMGLFYEGIINEYKNNKSNVYENNKYELNIINQNAVGLLAPLNYIKLNVVRVYPYSIFANHDDLNVYSKLNTDNANDGTNNDNLLIAGAPVAAVPPVRLVPPLALVNLSISKTEKYRPPTKKNINKTYETIIKFYKTKILSELYKFKSIIDEISNGQTINLHILYTEIYPKIIKLNTLLGNLSEGKKYKFKDEELVKFLNKINALFYIYYKIKGTRQMNKFNNYLLNDKNFKYFASKDIANNYNNLQDFNQIISQTGGTDVYDNILDLNNINNEKYYHIDVQDNNEVYNIINKLPESLYNDISIYYKYALIDLISRVLGDSSSQQQPLIIYTDKNIKNKLDKYMNALNINVLDKDLAGKFIIVQLINELLKQHFECHIAQAIVQLYSNKDLSLDFNEYLIINEFKIDLTTLNFPIITNLTQVSNMYSIMKKPIKNKEFIIYPTDFTNMNKFKIKYSFNINKDIIETLLINNSSLFSNNLENITPIYSLLKINNNEIIHIIKNQLENYDIKLNNLINKDSLEFIKQECKNNLFKIINTNNNPNINDIFKNINGYLYDDIKALILSNENFGNNLLLYLEESFSMSSYLIIEYLSDYIMNKDNFTINFNENIYLKLLIILNFNNNNLNKNYLASIINTFNISNDVNKFIAEQIKDELIKEYTFINSEIEKFTNPNNQKRIKLQLKITELNQKLNEINIILSTPLNIIKSKFILDELLINRYNKLNDNKEILIIHAWSKLLETGKLEDNYNLILIKMLIEQNKLLNKLDDEDNLNKLNTINLTLEQISNLCEYYFNDEKYYNENEVLKIIFNILVYLTKMVICNGIEYIIRRILFNYYTESSNSYNNLDFINTRINYIINKEIKDLNTNLHDILFNKISERFVKTATGIYEDNEDELLFQSETIRDILIEFFDHFKIFPYLNNIKPLFDSQVISYFDTFIGKTILLWMVNIENIFKFFINNYRSTDILLMLLK